MLERGFRQLWEFGLPSVSGRYFGPASLKLTAEPLRGNPKAALLTISTRRFSLGRLR